MNDPSYRDDLVNSVARRIGGRREAQALVTAYLQSVREADRPILRVIVRRIVQAHGQFAVTKSLRDEVRRRAESWGIGDSVTPLTDAVIDRAINSAIPPSLQAALSPTSRSGTEGANESRLDVAQLARILSDAEQNVISWWR